MKKLVSVMAALILFLCMLPLSASMEDVGDSISSSSFPTDANGNLLPIELRAAYYDDSSGYDVLFDVEDINWKWDSKNKILTLNGCTLNFASMGFSLPIGSKIIVNGTNTITTGIDTDASSLAAFWVPPFSANALSLNNEGSTKNSTADLTIISDETTGGTLTLNCERDQILDASSNDHLALIHVGGPLLIDNVTVILRGTNVTTGINAEAVTVNSSTLDFDLDVNSTVGNNSKRGSAMGIYSNRDVIITGSIVNIDATVNIPKNEDTASHELNSYGVLSLNGNAVIDSSTVQITAAVDSAAQNTDRLDSTGIAASENITINNKSNVTITTNVRAEYPVTLFSESNGISGANVSIGSTKENDQTVVTVNINSNASLESLNVDPDTGHHSIGIFGQKGISITNAQVGIIVSAKDGNPAGMYSRSVNEKIKINDCEVIINVSCVNGNSTGISSWGSVNVSNSENLTVTATTQHGESVGIETSSFDNVYISICDSNATVTVEGTISRGIYSPTINIGENGDDTSIVDITASHLEGENSSAVEVKGEEIHVDDNLVLVRGKEHTLDYSEEEPDYSEKVITDASEAMINWVTITSEGVDYSYPCVVCEGGRSLIRPKQNNTAVQSVSIGNSAGTTSDNTTYFIVLPYGSTIPTNPEDITIVLDDKYAVIEDLKTEDGGKTWTFTVLADAGQTDVQTTYIINVSVESAPVVPVDPVTPEPPVYNPPVYQPDDSGEELNGWRVLSGGTVYYRHSVKVKNWQKIDGESYYFDRQGYLQYGWLQQDGDWYYLDAATGAQQFGWVRVKNTWYYLDPETGKMYADGQYVIDRETYYFYDWGGMAAAWWYLDEDTGLWYYFRGNGALAKNAWIEWKDEYYYVGSSGAMLVNTTTPDGYRVDGDGKWIR